MLLFFILRYVTPTCNVAFILGNIETVSDGSGTGSGEHGSASECLYVTGTDGLLCEMLFQGPQEWLVPIHCSNNLLGTVKPLPMFPLIF